MEHVLKGDFMQSKLTLSLDSEVISQAKELARSSHTSLSRLIENYLRQIVLQNKIQEPMPGPILSQLTGTLKQLPQDSYQHYLEDKYL